MVDDSHRCGYVEVPMGHPLHGVGYHDSCPVLAEAYEKARNGPIGKRSYLTVFFHTPGTPSADIVFNVHGGLTFSSRDRDSRYPIPTDGWWFGFDCAHLDDKTKYSPAGEERSMQYVIGECESLAKQIEDAVAMHAAQGANR